MNGNVLARERPTPRVRRPCAPVVELAPRRQAERRRLHLARLREGMETSRRAFGRLFNAGLVFSRRGNRVGRELLLAHERLRELADRVERLEDTVTATEHPIFTEVERLLVRSDRLAARTLELVASR